jgi:hypothetical protein
MIRRDWNITSETPEWLLFSQPEHARLSWQLANAWKFSGDLAQLPHDDVLTAVRMHDDGWKTWEAEPQVDTQGKPIEFDEMPLVESLAIWTDSIELGSKQGPLIGYAIAGHFVALLERFNSWKDDPELANRAKDFLITQSRRMTELLNDWQAENPEQNTQANADLAVGCVQFFDALSLWFLTKERHDAETFQLNGGPGITLDPGEAGLLVVNPWPFVESSVWVSANGRTIPMRHYASAEDLSTQARHEVEMTWQLRNGG